MMSGGEDDDVIELPRDLYDHVIRELERTMGPEFRRLPGGDRLLSVLIKRWSNLVDTSGAAPRGDTHTSVLLGALRGSWDERKGRGRQAGVEPDPVPEIAVGYGGGISGVPITAAATGVSSYGRPQSFMRDPRPQSKSYVVASQVSKRKRPNPPPATVPLSLSIGSKTRMQLHEIAANDEFESSDSSGDSEGEGGGGGGGGGGAVDEEKSKPGDGGETPEENKERGAHRDVQVRKDKEGKGGWAPATLTGRAESKAGNDEHGGAEKDGGAEKGAEKGAEDEDEAEDEEEDGEDGGGDVFEAVQRGAAIPWHRKGGSGEEEGGEEDEEDLGSDLDDSDTDVFVATGVPEGDLLIANSIERIGHSTATRVYHIRGGIVTVGGKDHLLSKCHARLETR